MIKTQKIYAKSLEELLKLQVSEIKEGHTFKKNDPLDSEDDTDYIDEYIDENPITNLLVQDDINQREENQKIRNRRKKGRDHSSAAKR